MVNHALNPYNDMLCQVVGYTDTGLNRNTVLESTMDNFLLESLLSETGAQIAFSNGWRYGAPIPPWKDYLKRSLQYNSSKSSGFNCGIEW